MLWVVSILQWVMYSSILASVLSLIILIFKLLLKNKLGVRWHYAIWLILIIRLLIPYGPQSSVSVFNLFKTESGNIIKMSESANYKETYGISDYNQVSVVNSKNIKQDVIAKNDIKASESPIYLKLISIVWLLTVLILAVYSIVMTMKLKGKLKNEHKCKNEEVIALLLQCKNKFNLKSNITIVNTNLIKIPCILGFIKPKLLLPIGIENYVNINELEFIILHELAHVKRLDIIISCTAGALQIIHWFNPIIWYSFYKMRNDKELACDALALSHVNPDQYINYGKTIIKLLESYKKVPKVYGMSCIINDKSQIKRRITMISLFKKNSYKWSIIPIVALVLMGGVLLTNAKSKPVLAGNKNNQNLEAGKSLSDQSKTSSITEFAITGKHFKGTMLMIPSDKKIVVGFNKDILKATKTTSQIAKENSAICAINAGAFTVSSDQTLSPVGIIMHDGKIIFNDLKDNTSKTAIVAFTGEGRLLVGSYSLNELNNLNATEAVSFGPALIVNGNPTITKGDGGWGIAPRTAIGQKKDGTIIMLTIDGRSVKSLGATLLDVQNILLEHGAVNASNLDGGSSTTMYYKGKVINNPCVQLIKSGDTMIEDPDSKGEREVVSTFMVLP
ncbi:MAG: bla regulator protein BlaR1 [Clostridium sp.]|jgi:bla regulator protein BlaR1